MWTVDTSILDMTSTLKFREWMDNVPKNEIMGRFKISDGDGREIGGGGDLH